MAKTHRCEAKTYGMTRTLKTGGHLNRTTRCQSKDTVRAVLDSRAEWYDSYVAKGETEAWFCQDHRAYYDGSRGITKWTVPASSPNS